MIEDSEVIFDKVTDEMPIGINLNEVEWQQKRPKEFKTPLAALIENNNEVVLKQRKSVDARSQISHRISVL